MLIQFTQLSCHQNCRSQIQSHQYHPSYFCHPERTVAGHFTEYLLLSLILVVTDDVSHLHSECALVHAFEKQHQNHASQPQCDGFLAPHFNFHDAFWDAVQISR